MRVSRDLKRMMMAGLLPLLAFAPGMLLPGAAKADEGVSCWHCQEKQAERRKGARATRARARARARASQRLRTPSRKPKSKPKAVHAFPQALRLA